MKSGAFDKRSASSNGLSLLNFALTSSGFSQLTENDSSVQVPFDEADIFGQGIVRPGSPHGEDTFYDCVNTLGALEVSKKSQEHVFEKALETRRTSLSVKVDDSSQPLFSAMASPNGVRKRIKWFLMKHCQEQVGRTEELVNQIREGWISEDRLFEYLRKEYGNSSTQGSEHNDSTLGDYQVEEETKEDGSQSGRIGQTHNRLFSKEDIDSEELYITLTLEGLTSPSIRFSDTVLALRTDTEGRPLGPQTAPLREPHNFSTDEMADSLEDTYRIIAPRRRKKNKRRLRKLSPALKEELYQFREDLRPVREKSEPRPIVRLADTKSRTEAILKTLTNPENTLHRPDKLAEMAPRPPPRSPGATILGSRPLGISRRDPLPRVGAHSANGLDSVTYETYTV